MNLVFDIFPADDVRGTRLVRLTSDDYLEGTMFRTELVGVGKGRLVLQADQAVVTSANLARDNYVEVFDLTLSGAYALGAFFLEEGDFDALSDREQAGRILTFGGRGELSYLSRGVLGPTALSAAHGPLDQHWIDTLGSWKWGSLGSETYGAILRRIIYESALMTPDPLPEVQLVDIGWDDVVDYNAVPWPPFTGEYDIPVGTNLLEAAADLLKYGIELVANSDFEYRAYNAGGFGTNRTSATFATNKVRFEAGINIAADLSRAIHGSTDASHALLKDRSGFAFELITSPEYSAGDVVRYVGITSPEATGPDDLEALGEGVLTNRRAFVDQFAFPHPTGYTPLSGLYTPGPPDSAAHYWKGDYVTIHTGSSPYDANEQTIRVAAIEWNVDDAGNWLPTVELGAQYLSVAQANLQGQLSTIATSAHTHPPNPELCRQGAPFAPVGSMGSAGSTSGTSVAKHVVTGPNVERVQLTTTRSAAPSQCIVVIAQHTDNADPAWAVYDSAGNTYTPVSEHRKSISGNQPRVGIWYTNVTTALPLGGTIGFECDVGSDAGVGLMTGAKAVSAYLFNGTLSAPAESGTGSGFSGAPSVAVGGAALIVAAIGIKTDPPDDVFTPDADWTAFDLAGTGSGGETGTVLGGFRIGDSGGETYSLAVSASRDWATVGATFSTGSTTEGDLPADVGATDAAAVGTSVRAARCDHVHEHPSLTTGGPYHSAADVTFSPTGTIAATDVQAAIAEVAAEASGGGGVSLPDLEWLEPAGGNALVNAQTHSGANRSVARPVWIPKACTIEKVRLNLAVSSGTLGVAVYSDAFARLATSGSVSSPGVGWQDIDLTSDAVITTPGLYWLVFSASNTTISTYTINLAGTSGPFCTLMETAHPPPTTYVPGVASRAPVMIGLLAGGIV